MTFTAAQATALFDSVQSQMQALGIFQNVDTHEPENAPAVRLYGSITLGPVRPEPAKSGLNSVSGSITLIIRVWSHAMQKPLDSIDPEVLAVTAALMNALSGAFTLGGTVRNIDLFSLVATPVFAEFQGAQYRVLELPVPIVVNDMFTEVA